MQKRLTIDNCERGFLKLKTYMTLSDVNQAACVLLVRKNNVEALTTDCVTTWARPQQPP